MPDIERNAPCPCGSGAKYKRCCLPKQEAARPASVRDLEDSQDMLRDIVRFAERRLRWDLDELLTSLPDALVPEEAVPFWSHPFLFHVPFGDRTVAEQWLQSPRRTEHEEECRARMASWATLMEVTEVQRGSGFVATDLLTGETLGIGDKLASQHLHVHATLMGFPYLRNERCWLAITHPYLLPPDEAKLALKATREALKLRAGKNATREALAKPESVIVVAMAWAAAVHAAKNRGAPKLQNTDGDPLLLVEEHFDAPLAKPAALLAAIASIDGAEEPDESDDGWTVTVLKQGNAQHAAWENTVIGHVVVPRAGRVTISTNSERRADDLRARFEAACGPLVTRRGRSIQDAFAAIERGKALSGHSSADDLPHEEKARLLRELKARMYADWPDAKLPALGGLTPRQAVTGPAKARRTLAELLKQMQFDEARLPVEERCDLTIILRALGML